MITHIQANPNDPLPKLLLERRKKHQVKSYTDNRRMPPKYLSVFQYAAWFNSTCRDYNLMVNPNDIYSMIKQQKLKLKLRLPPLVISGQIYLPVPYHNYFEVIDDKPLEKHELEIMLDQEQLKLALYFDEVEWKYPPYSTRLSVLKSLFDINVIISNKSLKDHFSIHTKFRLRENKAHFWRDLLRHYKEQQNEKVKTSEIQQPFAVGKPSMVPPVQ